MTTAPEPASPAIQDTDEQLADPRYQRGAARHALPVLLAQLAVVDALVAEITAAVAELGASVEVIGARLDLADAIDAAASDEAALDPED